MRYTEIYVQVQSASHYCTTFVTFRVRTSIEVYAHICITVRQNVKCIIKLYSPMYNMYYHYDNLRIVQFNSMFREMQPNMTSIRINLYAQKLSVNISKTFLFSKLFKDSTSAQCKYTFFSSCQRKNTYFMMFLWFGVLSFLVNSKWGRGNAQ